jgi:predicted nucleic acid-binding protein
VGLTHLADTSVLIEPPPAGAIEGPHLIATSVICLGELEAGVLLARTAGIRAARLRRLAAVAATVPALPIDAAVASHYAEIRAASGRAPANDLWIAATAQARALVLVTRDERLASIPGSSTLLVT